MKAYRPQKIRQTPNRDDDYEGKIYKKKVIVQIESNQQSREHHEFDTAKECAEFLGLTEEQVQILGGKHLVLKRDNQKIRISCDELTEVRILKKENKKINDFDFPYKPHLKTVWVDLDKPIFGYTQINNLGVLRKITDKGFHQRKEWRNEENTQIYRFLDPQKEEGMTTIQAKPLFKKYVCAFDEAFNRKEKRRGKQATTQA